MTEKQLREKYVNTAISYLGAAEGTAKHREIVDIYNSHKPLARSYALQYTDAWCAGFVSAMSIKCGLTDIIPTEVGCGAMITLYQKMGRWVENDAYVPNVSDIIFYDWADTSVGDNKGSSDHVGIVVSVTGNVMRVIEGNKNDAVEYRDIAVNGKYIRGYGIPDFASKATDDGMLSKGDSGEKVKELQENLIKLGYSCGAAGADGEFGNGTLAAVKKFQADKKLVVDGIVGPQTLKAIEEALKAKESEYTLEQFIRDVQEACGAKVDGIAGAETLSKTVTLSIRKNRTHKVVKAVQKRLYALGYTSVGEADGIIGVKFTTAVRLFQLKNGCWADGVITAKNKTWKKLLGMA